MTRKDYVLIANSLKECLLIAEGNGSAAAYFNNGVKRAALSLSDDFARDNARFDRERFLTACGVQS